MKIAQIVVAVLLIAVILMQSRGTGLSATFGGGNEVFSAKRGAEKFLERATVVLAVIFVGLAAWSMFA